MIRSLFDLSFKNKLVTWWGKRRIAIQAEYDLKEKDFLDTYNKRYVALQGELNSKMETLERDKRSLDDVQTRVDDRQKELERVNAELKTQIRLIEAKASPDSVWQSAFSQGFSKAWDMMMPLMTQGIDKVKEKIRAEEIDASFPRIDMIVEQRIKETASRELMDTFSVEKKRREFQVKLSQTADDDEKRKLTNYLSVIDWILGSKNGD